MGIFDQRPSGPMSPIEQLPTEQPVVYDTSPMNGATPLYAGAPIQQEWGINAGAPVYEHVPQPGYGVAHGAGQRVYHGMPISLAMARLINQENAADQQAYQASMAGARNTQLIQAQNNPETYRIAQEYIASGVPAHQAVSLAMTQVTAGNGDYLGLGATLPVAQQAIDQLSGNNLQLGTLFGISSPSISSGGAFNIQSSNPVRGMRVSPDGTASLDTSLGQIDGVNGNQVGTAVGWGSTGAFNAPIQSTMTQATGIANGANPAVTKQRQISGTTVSNAADKAINSLRREEERLKREQEKQEKAEEKKAKEAAKLTVQPVYGMPGG